MAVPLLTWGNNDLVRSGYLCGIFGRFGALRGLPGVWMGDLPPQEKEGVGQTGDRFQVKVPLFTWENNG